MQSIQLLSPLPFHPVADNQLVYLSCRPAHNYKGHIQQKHMVNLFLSSSLPLQHTHVGMIGPYECVRNKSEETVYAPGYLTVHEVITANYSPSGQCARVRVR